jgi:hypothetical protein
MPSSTAARVACNASSTRAFFSFISVSVAAPTLITAIPPRELGQTLLELLPIVVGCSLLDLTPNLTDATLDVLSRTFAFDDRGAIFVDGDPLGAAQIVQRDTPSFDRSLSPW